MIRIMRKLAGKIYYGLIDRIPSAWKAKYEIIKWVMQNNWWTVVPTMYWQFKSVRPDQIESGFEGLDDRSIQIAKDFVSAWQNLDGQHFSYRQDWRSLCTAADIAAGKEQEQQIQGLKSQYSLMNAEFPSLIRHHGLRGIPAAMKAYIRNKAFIDAGACEGDSSLVFQEYEPSCVYAFEPSPANQNLFVATMQRNQVSEQRVKLVAKGLDGQEGEVFFKDAQSSANSLQRGGSTRVELITLDRFVQDLGLTVGVIKADLEGMGLKMLRGALGTIRRDMPVLSLSIYHNVEEFLGIYQLLKEQGLNYEYRLEKMCLPWDNLELTLMAFPRL